MKTRLPLPTAGSNCETRVSRGFEEGFAALGRGKPLPSSERAFFEARFGHDFSHVRTHSGPAANELAGSVHARAFTLGSEIVLGRGQSASGHLLAHELTHVVQQASTGEARVQRQYGYDTNDPWLMDMSRNVKPGPVRTTRLRNDPTFMLEDLQRLQHQGVALSFSGSLAPIPSDAQQLLLDNIAQTVRFVLDPNDPGRMREQERLRRQFEAGNLGDKFYDRPALGLDATDLYHGHICVPQTVLANSPNLKKLQDTPYSGYGKYEHTPGKDLRKAIGMQESEDRMPTQAEAAKVMEVAERHRPQYLQALSALLQALAKEPTAGVMYHSWEIVPIDKPPRDHPVRNIFTPLSTHQPKFAVGAKERDCTTLIHIGFHVDRRSGRITLFPGSEKQMVRAYELLHPPASP